MASDSSIQEGKTATYSSTSTREDVAAFAEVSNDEGAYHMRSNEDSPVVLHGLLTDTMPTKLGGDIDFLPRTMEFEFPALAYTGAEITCETTSESLERRDNHISS